MGRVCVVFGCGFLNFHKSGVNTYDFPSVDSPYRRLWINFVKMTRQNFSSPAKCEGICGLHFTDDSFEDQYTHLLKQQAGLRSSRKLKVDAVPTILTEECITVLSEHSPAQTTVAKQANTYSVREGRTKRELMKEMTVLKQADTEFKQNEDKKNDTTSCSTTTNVRNTSVNAASNMLSESIKTEMPSSLNSESIKTEVPSVLNPDLIKTEMPAVLTTESIKTEMPFVLNPELIKTKMPAVLTTESIKTEMPFVWSPKSIKFEMPSALDPELKFTVDIGVGTSKPHKRSVAILAKPSQKSVGVQCLKHKCDCKNAATRQPTSLQPRKLKRPLNYSRDSEVNMQMHLECDSD